MYTDFVLQVKCTIFWLNSGLMVYLDLYAPDFPKSTSKYLLLVKKHGSRCFTAMFFFFGFKVLKRIILSCPIIQILAFIHFLVWHLFLAFWHFWHFGHFGIMRPKSRHHERAKMPKPRHLWSLMMSTFESQDAKMPKMSKMPRCQK